MFFRSKSVGTKIAAVLSVLMLLGLTEQVDAQTASQKIFGENFKNLESLAVGEWWEKKPRKRQSMNLNVPRDQVCAFAVYTHDHSTLKLTAQFFPLKPDEEKVARLEFKQPDGTWKEVAREQDTHLIAGQQ